MIVTSKYIIVHIIFVLRMNDDGKSSQGFNVAVKGSALLISTSLPTMISLWFLTYSSYVHGAIRSIVLLISVGCFFLGSLLIVVFGFSREKGILWISGLAISFGIFVVSAVLYCFTAHTIESLIVSGFLFFLGYRVFSYLKATSEPTRKPSIINSTSNTISLSKISLSNKLHIGAIELVQISESHFTSPTSLESYKPYLDLLRALTLAGVSLALRIERISSKTRIFYLSWAKKESILIDNITKIEDNLTAILLGMKFIIIPRYSGIKLEENQVAVISSLKGEPLSVEHEEQRLDALSSTVKVLQGFSNGIIQISACPRSFSSRKLKSLEDQYRQEIAKSERVVSTPRSDFLVGEIQESVTRVDPRAQRKASSLAIRIDRLSKKNLCDVQVSAICWDSSKSVAQENSKRLLTTLRGRLEPADRNNEFSVESSSSIVEVGQFLRGEPVGKPTLLSIGEAASYFIIPNCDVGIPVGDHAAFHSNPATLSTIPDSISMTSEPHKPYLVLGKILDDSGREIGEFRVPIEDLPTHSIINGDIGTGKTTTQLCILHELYEKCINFLVFLKSKNEDYLRFVRTIDDVRILTIGDDTISAARFCLTAFHEGVHVNQIINSIKTVFVASKPMEGMVREYSEKVIEFTFKRLGWDRDSNTRGLPIVLQDFLKTIPLIENELQYSTRGNQDFRGALIGRFSSICESVLAGIFGTITGMSIEELVSKPTIILLDKLSKEEAAFFMFWMINNLALYYEALKKTEGPSEVGLKYYVVLEEAHRFLESSTGVNIEEGHGAYYEAMNTVCVTMTESRSSGLGFGLTTPEGVKLSSSASTMALNVFMHKTNSIMNREVMGHQINCNDDQITKIGSLEKGVAVVRTASSTKPVLVRINNPFVLYPKSNSDKPVSDEDIKKHMKPIHEENPHFAIRFDFTKNVPLILELQAQSTPIIKIAELSKLYSMIKQPKFKGVIKGIEGLIQKDDSLLTSLTIKHIVKSVTDDEDIQSFCINHLLWLFSKMVDSWSGEFEELVISNITCHLFSESKLICSFDSEIHERMHRDLMKRKLQHNSDEVANLLTAAVKAAIDEQNNHNSTSTKSKPKASDVDNKSLQMIDAIIKTQHFSSRYIERLGNASNGDIEPFLRFVLAFSRKLSSSSERVLTVSLLLLERARSIHNQPVDETLWNRISEAVKATLTDRGSAVAT